MLIICITLDEFEYQLLEIYAAKLVDAKIKRNITTNEDCDVACLDV